MTTLFDRLGYNFNDPDSKVNEFSDGAKAHLDSMPPFLEDWQANDIANNTVNGYLTNPFSTTMSTVNTSITLIRSSLPANGGSTTAISNLFSNIANTCKALTGYTYNSGDEITPVYVTVEGEISKFIGHTNRISGVTTTRTLDTFNKPFYKDAIGVGKSISYIAYQTSNVTNTAAVMGSFTSLLIGNTVNTWISTISTYANTINASISLITGTSSLSLSTVSTMDANIAEINSTIYTRRVHDENYYVNAKTVINEVTELRSYSSRGSSEDYLLQNINGTEKLLTRINA